MSTDPFVVGLDLSMTSTGVCRIGHDLCAVTERVKSKGTWADTLLVRQARLADLAGRILARTTGATLVTVESPAFSRAGAGTHDRSGLWWMVVSSLISDGVPLIEISPSTRPTYATGKGNAGKDEVLAAVVRRYLDVDVAGNDEADALVLAAMGARLMGRPIEASLPLSHLRALDKLSLPEGLAAHPAPVPLAA